MNENAEPFSIGSAAVILETEEIVRVTGFGSFAFEKIIRFVDEDGKTGWRYQDELQDFHSWVMNEIEFDF